MIRFLLMCQLISLVIGAVVIGSQLFLVVDPNTITLSSTSVATLRIVKVESWFELDQSDPNYVKHFIVETLERQ